MAEMERAAQSPKRMKIHPTLRGMPAHPKEVVHFVELTEFN